LRGITVKVAATEGCNDDLASLAIHPISAWT
jgi:hypothetical protein